MKIANSPHAGYDPDFELRERGIRRRSGGIPDTTNLYLYEIDITKL
jgi:hypothetical protein